MLDIEDILLSSCFLHLGSLRKKNCVLADGSKNDYYIAFRKQENTSYPQLEFWLFHLSFLPYTPPKSIQQNNLKISRISGNQLKKLIILLERKTLLYNWESLIPFHQQHIKSDIQSKYKKIK